MTLKIPNMHCEQCVATMRDALKEKIDEIELDADFKNQVLTITFTNEGTSGEDVAEILTEAGFEPLTTKAD